MKKPNPRSFKKPTNVVGLDQDLYGTPKPRKYTESEVRDLIEKSKKPLNLLDQFEEASRHLARLDIRIAETRANLTELESERERTIRARLDLSQQIGHEVAVGINR